MRPAELGELACLVPLLEEAADASWPTISGEPLSFGQWTSLLLEFDSNRGASDGECYDIFYSERDRKFRDRRPIPDRVDAKDPAAAVDLMRLRYERGIGLYHPDEDRPMGLMTEFATRGEPGNRRGDLMDEHWSEDDDEPDQDEQIGFGCYPGRSRRDDHDSVGGQKKDGRTHRHTEQS